MQTRKPLYRSAVRVGIGVALVLSLPLGAMLVSDDVVWSAGDFAVAGVLSAAFGKAGDAPGLVLVGVLLVVGACAVGVRAARQSG